MKKLILLIFSLTQSSVFSQFIFTDGAYTYQIISETPPEVEVFERDFSDNATSITIVSEVIHNGTRYTVTQIADFTFNSMLLESVELPNTLKVIGRDAFSQNSLTSLVIPSNVTNIGVLAFANNNIENLDIPSSVLELGEGAFLSNNISDISFQDGIERIGVNAFQANNINVLILPNTVVEVGEGAFLGNELTSLTLSQNLSEISKRAFANNNLTEVIIPDNITIIDDNAFQNNMLGNIDIPSSIEEIGNGAFSINRLENVTIPSSVTFIGDFAFANNDQLTAVTSASEEPAILGTNAFGEHSNIDLTIPENTSLDYFNAGWFGFRSVIEDNTLSSLVFDLKVKEVFISTSNKFLVIDMNNELRFKGVDIFDLSGKKVIESKMVKTSIDHLETGVYILMIYIGGHFVSYKVKV